MDVGVAYYPEHHDPSEWAGDYEKLAAAGIGSIRIGEFAWTCMEPREGQFDWKWLDDAIELAGAYGISVVLCTPTACPPIWLTELHPDVLPVHKSGRTVGFGARQHRSYCSSNYVEYADRIAEKLAERYGDHPNVTAWQLDNEFGGETKYDYSDNAKRAFHLWLAERYGMIDALNKAWGTVFWSQRYERFDQIPLPAPIESDVMMWQHPSLELEFAKFSSESIVAFAVRQARILRKHVGARPITTNAFMFRWGDSVDWSRLFTELDVVGMDIYSDKPYEIAFYCDACRGVLDRPFWMMEYGTGSPRLREEMTAIAARGCDQFYLFKMKPFPWGQEQGRGQAELLTITGEPSPAYEAVKQYAAESAAGQSGARSGAGLAEETAALSEAELGEGSAALSADRSRLERANAASIALYYDFESSWSYKIAVSDRLSYPDYFVDTVYQALYDAGRGADVVYRAEQVEGHSAVILPLHTLYDEQLEERLIHYAKAGGKVIVTSDFFRKNEHNVFLTRLPRIFTELFDWHDNNFVTDAVRDRKALMYAYRNPNGGGGWIVSRDASQAEWADILEDVFAKI